MQVDRTSAASHCPHIQCRWNMSDDYHFPTPIDHIDQTIRDRFAYLIRRRPRGSRTIKELRQWGEAAILLLLDEGIMYTSERMLEWAMFMLDHMRDMLLPTLYHADPGVRHRAAYALGQLQDEQAVMPLLDHLNDPDVNVRMGVIFALETIGDRRAVAPLIALLQDNVLIIRIRVIEALQTLGDSRAVEPIIECLVDPDSDVRQHAAEALGELGDPRAVEPLIAALSYLDENVQGRAAEALAHLHDQRAVEPLMALLNHLGAKEVRTFDEISVQAYAAYALGRLGDRRAVDLLIPFLQHFANDVCWAAAIALGMLGDERAIGPLEQLAASDDPREVSWSSDLATEAAAEAIRQIRTRCQETEGALLLDTLPAG